MKTVVMIIRYTKTIFRMCRMRKVKIGIVLLLALGFFLRFNDLGRFLLWPDEIWVASSIRQPTIGEMIFLRWWPQTTPVLFLLLTRILVFFFGTSEFVLHSIPCISNFLVLPLGYLLAKKITGNRIVGLLFMFIWATNPVALHYASELKRYSSDALMTVVVIVIWEYAMSLLNDGKYWKWLFITLLSSCLAMMMSYTIIFVLPALIVRQLIGNKKHSELMNNRYVISNLMYCLAFLCFFFILYRIIIVPAANSTGLLPVVETYWQKSMLQFNGIGGLKEVFVRLVNHFGYFLQSKLLITKGAPLIIASIALMGVFNALKNKKWLLLVYLSVPILLNVLAAYMGKYPFDGRRSAFYLAPLFFILISYSFVTLVGNKNWKWSIPLLSLAFLIPFSGNIVKFDTLHKHKQSSPALLAMLARRTLPSDQVGIISYSASYFKYYSPLQAQVFKIGSYGNSKGVAGEIQAMIEAANQGRLWFFYHTSLPYAFRQQKKVALEILSEQCVLLERHRLDHDRLFLFDCSEDLNG